MMISLIQPTYWFASHLHVKYPAIFPHKSIDADGDEGVYMII